jgi:hypothetical protein
MEYMAGETELSAQGTMMDDFFFQTHTNLSLHLIRGNTHSLAEGCTYEIFEWDDHITLLAVVDLSYYKYIFRILLEGGFFRGCKDKRFL